MTTKAFRQLHEGPNVLLLANCWDAGSAKAIERAGARAIATTSAGVAWALGFPDGNALPVERLVATVESIARVISVPLSVDAEAGYSDDPARVAENVARIARAGAVGINLEDGTGTPELLATKIERVKSAADVFVYARIDVYLKSLVPAPQRVEETLARAARYRAAGADGVFVPGVIDPAEIRTIAAAVGLPLNVLARPKLPNAKELAALGVRRLSAGSAIAQSVFQRTTDLARAFMTDGESEPLSREAADYGQINSTFAAR